MNTFRSLTADQRPLHRFKSQAKTLSTPHAIAPTSNIPLHLFEWSEDSPDGREVGGLKSVEDLEARIRGPVRAIFAPRDEPLPETANGLCNLFKKCEIPSAFIDEGLQGVSQSFAAQRDVDGTMYIWFHFLCKDLEIREERIVHDPNGIGSRIYRGERHRETQQQSQANFTWLKPGFVLKIKDEKDQPPAPSRTMTSGSDQTLPVHSNHKQVTLFCFGAPMSIGNRFRTLIGSANLESLLEDPYFFLDVVFEEMYRFMDDTVWKVSDIFGAIETRTVGIANKPAKSSKALLEDHFTGLHNLAKHIIYLRQNCDSALATLQDLRDHYESVSMAQRNALREATKQSLQYRKTQFQSTLRKLTSLDSRMANTIQLSFHIVTQKDSRVMQSESQSMKAIAVVTLLFMPLSTVSGIFGTQFMRIEEESPFRLTVSRDFWLLWVISVPLTTIIIIFWRVWYWDARARLTHDLPELNEGEHKYMGWKALQRSILASSTRIPPPQRIEEYNAGAGWEMSRLRGGGRGENVKIVPSHVVKHDDV